MQTLGEYSYYDREKAIYKAALDLLEADKQLLQLDSFTSRTKVTFDVDNQQIRISCVLDAEVLIDETGATLTVKDKGIGDDYPQSPEQAPATP